MGSAVLVILLVGGLAWFLWARVERSKHEQTLLVNRFVAWFDTEATPEDHDLIVKVADATIDIPAAVKARAPVYIPASPNDAYFFAAMTVFQAKCGSGEKQAIASRMVESVLVMKAKPALRLPDE